MKASPPTRHAGLSTVELLCILLVACLVVGLGYVYLFGLPGHGPSVDSKVITEIYMIKAAAAAHQAEFGESPVYPEDPDDPCLGLAYNDLNPPDTALAELVTKLETAYQRETGEQLPKLDPFRSFLGTDKNAVCGYRYYCQGNDALYVWSHGPDGQDGTEDDIGEKPRFYQP